MTAAAGAVFGVPGQGAYAAANAYLDGLARARHRQGCHTVSLDWVVWRGLGFASDAQIALQELERLGSRPVTAEEAFTAWEYLERYDVAQAVMAPLPSSDVPAASEAQADITGLVGDACRGRAPRTRGRTASHPCPRAAACRKPSSPWTARSRSWASTR